MDARWVWVPGYDWDPAWVCWREADSYCGGAPLPPAATYQVGVGLHYKGHLALDVDFGLDMDVFTFVRMTISGIATFAHFCCRANGWALCSGAVGLGQTDGTGRHARDFYVHHDQPKRLFCRELVKNARRSLQAEHLRPALAAIAAKAPARPTQTAPALKSLCDHFKIVSDYLSRIGF